MQTDTQITSRKSILSVSAERFMTFGDQLYRWRKAKGLTQQELAVASGVNVSYISNLERNFSATTKSGKPRPSEGLCEKFAKVLGVDLDEVRTAAGYAVDSGILFAIAPDIRIALLDKDLSEEEQAEIAQELGFAYEVLMARKKARKQ